MKHRNLGLNSNLNSTALRRHAKENQRNSREQRVQIKAPFKLYQDHNIMQLVLQTYQEDVVQCGGECQLSFHNYCTGVSVAHLKISENATTCVCLACSQLQHETTIAQLKSEVMNPKAEVARLSHLQLQHNRRSSRSLSPNDAIPSQDGGGCILVASQGRSSNSTVPTKSSSRNIAARSTTANISRQERKFNVVVYTGMQKWYS